VALNSKTKRTILIRNDSGLPEMPAAVDRPTRMQFTPYQAKKELSHTEVVRRRTTANASRTSFNNAKMPKVADES